MADSRLSIGMTLLNNAVTQLGYNFNSFAVLDGRLMAANEDGLFLIGGDGFNGSDIDAYFKFNIDFGEVVVVRSAWDGFESTGSLTHTLTFDDRTAELRSETLSPYYLNNQEHGERIYFGRGDQGRMLNIKIENVAGCDFSFDTMSLEVIPRGNFRT